MKLQPITAIACIILLFAGSAETVFAQSKGSVAQHAIAPDLDNELSANEWALVRIFNIKGVEDADWPRSSAFRNPSVTLIFHSSGHISGQVCNLASWRYSLLKPGRIKISPDFMTYAACDDAAIMRLESLVFGKISSAINVHINEDENGSPQLTLRTSDGSQLVFQALRTKPK
ncbi:META domain-containing protein [Acidovorax sp. NPDC077693]|uniref:META domain-containing protein n=1 Tax=unclassified Acidovorax TaxID=2684926 RepID=UPI0037CB0BA6